ncbi:unnamed protein product [Brassicogethes aeneus]|uniref:Max-binding protein MNT n=1 Tax=Brassicogethes aeneus TaxID=1431903 RepID=A0A9P0AVH0_BRAAE|nr:unnamed protein product [Brassicogethes aeneus]
MSLSTLIEAAEFLEQQEKQKELQKLLTTNVQVGADKTPVVHRITAAPQLTAKNINFNQNGQTVVISSNINLQGPLIAPNLIKKEQDQHVSSTVVTHPRHRVLHNSFDIMNPLVIDETHEIKRKIPPMAFRAGTREVHNKLEKHRRAHLKECFDVLKKQLPQNQDEKKTSNLSILHHALRYIQSLKRRERDLEHEIERLAREKICNQQRILVLRKELPTPLPPEIAKLMPELIAANTSNDILKSEGPSVIQTNGLDKMIPIVAKTTTASVTSVKEVSSTQSVQATQLSVLPVSYPVNQGLVLQKVAIVQKGLTDLTPLMQTHFIATNQQINGKVLPVTQYLVKPVVVVSTASRPS